MSEHESELGDLGAELRQRVEHEFRWEAEELESDAEKLRTRGRTIGDVAQELMEQGDTVAVVSGTTTVTGPVIYAGGDLAVLQTGHALASVHLNGPIIMRIAARSQKGGVSADRGSGSFKARLAEFEQTGEVITLIVGGTADTLDGRVTTVGKDHIIVTGRDGTEWLTPLANIALALQPLSR